jgi:glycosyltransferase involved in cell wall biosynthesis
VTFGVRLFDVRASPRSVPVHPGIDGTPIGALRPCGRSGSHERARGLTATLKLGLFAASPMYYQAPLYRRLATFGDLEFTAIFASSGGVTPRDVGFGLPVVYEGDVLSGYRSIFLNRAESNPIGGTFLTFRDTDVVGVVANEKFDVLWVHGYNSLTHVLAVLAQRAMRRPLLFREEQTLLAPRPRWKQSVKKVAFPLLFGPATAVYIGSENRRWLRRFGFPDGRLFPAPYCVDGEWLCRSLAELPPRAEVRARFGLDGEAPVILTVARLSPEKQVDRVLDAFAIVRRDQPCQLLIVGAGEQGRALHEKVRRDAIPDVKFAGYLRQSEIPAAYRASDIFTLFSNYEPWGLVVNEAMHCGLPVVASERVGSAYDLIQEAVTGHVVDHRDVHQLADRLRVLVGDPELRQTMGQAARAHATAWNYDRAADGIARAARAAFGLRVK